MQRNSILVGLLIGLCLPIMAYGVLLQLNDWIVALEIPVGGKFTFDGFKKSTLAIVALCANLIPFHYFIRNRFDYSMRGIIFPTVLFAIYWVIHFGKLSF